MAEQKVVIAEDLQTRWKLAKAQLSLLPSINEMPEEEHWEGTQAYCHELVELIERASLAESKLAEAQRDKDKLVKALALAMARSHRHGFPSIPEEFRGRGCGRAAYDAGFETGLRGWKFDQPYKLSRHRRAYLNGYREGQRITQLESDEIYDGLIQKHRSQA